MAFCGKYDRPPSLDRGAKTDCLSNLRHSRPDRKNPFISIHKNTNNKEVTDNDRIPGCILEYHAS